MTALADLGREDDRLPCIGVVVVTYDAEDFIEECLASLLASGYPALHVIVADNGSRDGTVEAVRQWCRETVGPEQSDGDLSDSRRTESWRSSGRHSLTFSLLRNGANLGFAGGVNSGLSFLIDAKTVDLYWILNPDTVVDPEAPGALVAWAQAREGWGIIGARVLYHARPDRVHTDGGVYRRWMGFAKSFNLGRKVEDCRPPGDAKLDYVSGASMLVSKAFLATAGLMDESWFLYFEEIDWAFRRKGLTLSIAPDAIVHHRAGASIGSGSGHRVDSAFSVYFMYRNRIRFAWRWTPAFLPSVYGWSWAMLIRRYWRHPQQLIAGIWGVHGLGPPQAVRRRLPPADWELALGGARPRVSAGADERGGDL
ncbi:glycosyltransferase family 2 protein [Algihabitans albus]|uniref:glycosyltransferase family 2 protein n=1 Tax=Algihabitans albus TaxID=2164067 RepID=UPI0013C33A75|nr:glycosyltransferase family 2 protein [Algihabitans albus]